MTCRELELSGAWVMEPEIFEDERGSFVKTMHGPLLQKLGIEFIPHEEFFSASRTGVLRGMHFQIPPADHAKLVYCIRGKVLDVIVDIRRGSPTYGKYCSVDLNDATKHVLYIPSGFAHGFLALEDDSVMVYKTTREHVPDCDKGIRWDSFGFDWPVADPTISARDQAHPPLRDFSSPFCWE